MTTAPPKSREIEAAKARARAAERYGLPVTSASTNERSDAAAHAYAHEHGLAHTHEVAPMRMELTVLVAQTACK